MNSPTFDSEDWTVIAKLADQLKGKIKNRTGENRKARKRLGVLLSLLSTHLADHKGRKLYLDVTMLIKLRKELNRLNEEVDMSDAELQEILTYLDMVCKKLKQEPIEVKTTDDPAPEAFKSMKDRIDQGK